MTQFKYEFRIPNSRIYPNGRENDGLDEKDMINITWYYSKEVKQEILY